MSEQSEEYERYNHIAKNKTKQAFEKKKVEVWQLVFEPTGEKVVHGSYALCKSRKNTFADTRYKIIPNK